MVFVSCQLLKCSRGVSWNWGCALGCGTESHRDTSGCRDLLGRLCCISPGNHTWQRLIHFVCSWASFRKNRLVLSKAGPKRKDWCSVGAQQTGTEDDLENWAITWCRVPWTALSCFRDQRGHRVSLTGATERTHVPSSLTSQMEVQHRQWASTRNLLLPLVGIKASICSSSSRDKN